MSTEEWKSAKDYDLVKHLMLGWDVTDFGSGDFKTTGAVLFTLRSGTLGEGSPYAEKLIMFCRGSHPSATIYKKLGYHKPRAAF